MNNFKRFSDIGQFRNVVKYYNVSKNHNTPTKIPYRGTVKLHGTNAAICMDSELSIFYQSRNKIITPDNDNCGFATHMQSVVGEYELKKFLGSILKELDMVGEPIRIFGEWCGEGIQSGVAISMLPRMFVIFSIQIGEGDSRIKIRDHLFSCKEHRIFNIRDFGCYYLTVDFDTPNLVVNKMVEITEEVEKRCPVAWHFGVDGIGEGVVWEPIDDWFFGNSDMMFKVKGEKHSVTKVKKLTSVDPEKITNATNFVENTVTENRLNQAIDYLKENNHEISRKSTGIFLKWLVSDIMKEEHDVMEASGLETRDVNGMISKKGKDWFFNKIDTDFDI